jgi:hypothetical protein
MQTSLLVDVKVSSLAQSTNGVWLGVWHHRQLQSLDDLNWDHVLMDLVVNNEM